MLLGFFTVTTGCGPRTKGAAAVALGPIQTRFSPLTWEAKRWAGVRLFQVSPKAVSSMLAEYASGKPRMPSPVASSMNSEKPKPWANS